MNEESVDFVMRLRPDWSIHPNPATMIPWDIDPSVVARILEGWGSVSMSCCCPPATEKVNWKQEGF